VALQGPAQDCPDASRCDDDLSQGTMGVLLWNPHWECFVKSEDCKEAAEIKWTKMLALADFATAIMFEAPDYSPPSSHSRTEKTCGRDPVAMFWDNAKWAETDLEVMGCIVEDDRPFIIKSFKRKHAGLTSQPADGAEVLMISAHFPHPANATVPWESMFAEELITRIKESLAEKPHAGVIFAADTNLDFADSSAEIMHHLGVPGDIIGSTPAHTCCYNDGYSYASDRVATNIPGSVDLELFLYDPTPSWAKLEGAGHHKPVLARFNLSEVWSNAGFEHSISV